MAVWCQALALAVLCACASRHIRLDKADSQPYVESDRIYLAMSSRTGHFCTPVVAASDSRGNDVTFRFKDYRGGISSSGSLRVTLHDSSVGEVSGQLVRRWPPSDPPGHQGRVDRLQADGTQAWS